MGNIFLVVIGALISGLIHYKTTRKGYGYHGWEDNPATLQFFTIGLILSNLLPALLMRPIRAWCRQLSPETLHRIVYSTRSGAPVQLGELIHPLSYFVPFCLCICATTVATSMYWKWSKNNHIGPRPAVKYQACDVGNGKLSVKNRRRIGLCCLIGGLFFIGFAVEQSWEVWALERRGIETKGTVTEYVQSAQHSRAPHMYQVDYAGHRGEFDLGREGVPLASEVLILYNPQNPNSAVAMPRDALWSATWRFILPILGYGVIFMALGIHFRRR